MARRRSSQLACRGERAKEEGKANALVLTSVAFSSFDVDFL